MSDTGLYSGLYEEILEYAHALDEIIFDLKEGRGIIHNRSWQVLGDLVSVLAGDKPGDLSVRLIALLVRDRDVARQSEWREVRRLWQSQSFEGKGASLGVLERLASSLECEQVGAMQRMKGYLR